LLIVAILAFGYIFYTGIATLFGNKNDFNIKSSKSTLLIASIIFFLAVMLLNSLTTDINENKQTTSENLTISQTEQFSLQARCFEIIKNHKLCKEQNYGLFISNDCWDDFHTRVLSTACIALNIHHYENNTILEVHRIVQYVMNKIIVITEKSDDEYYNNMMEGLVFWADENTFVDKINEIFTISDIEGLLLDRQRKLINKKSMSKLLSENIALFANADENANAVANTNASFADAEIASTNAVANANASFADAVTDADAGGF
jgi:hypothetical protein